MQSNNTEEGSTQGSRAPTAPRGSTSAAPRGSTSAAPRAASSTAPAPRAASSTVGAATRQPAQLLPGELLRLQQVGEVQ